MKNFSASLVREKIVFIDETKDEMEEDIVPAVVRSNRIFLELSDAQSTEKVVIRAQNMHTTLRLASRDTV